MDYKKLLLGCLGVTVVAMLVVAALSDKQQPALTGQVSSCDMNNGDECDELHMTEHCDLNDTTSPFDRVCDLNTCTWDTSNCTATPVSKPNLIVSSMYQVGVGAQCNDGIFPIEIRVENTGQADVTITSTAEVSLYTSDGITPLGADNIFVVGTIPAGGHTTFNINESDFPTHTFVQDESFTFQVELDINNDIVEENEGDNTRMLGPESYKGCGADFMVTLVDGNTHCPDIPFYTEVRVENVGVIAGDSYVIAELIPLIGADPVAKARLDVSTLIPGGGDVLEFRAADFKTIDTFVEATGAGTPYDLSHRDDSTLYVNATVKPAGSTVDTDSTNDSMQGSAYYASCLPNYVIDSTSYSYDASSCSGNEILVDVSNQGQDDGQEFQVTVTVEESLPDNSTVTHSNTVSGPMLVYSGSPTSGDTSTTVTVPFSFEQNQHNSYVVDVSISPVDNSGITWEEKSDGNERNDLDDVIDASQFCMSNLTTDSADGTARNCASLPADDDGFYAKILFKNDGELDITDPFTIHAVTGQYEAEKSYPPTVYTHNGSQWYHAYIKRTEFQDANGDSPGFIPGDKLNVTFTLDSDHDIAESDEGDNSLTAEIDYQTCLPNLIPTVSDAIFYPRDGDKLEIQSTVKNESIRDTSNVSIRFDVENVEGNTVYTHTYAGESFTAGEERTFNHTVPYSHPWDPDATPDDEAYKIYVTVDPSNLITETDEWDNVATKSGIKNLFNNIVDQVTGPTVICKDQDATITIDFSQAGVPAPPEVTYVDMPLTYVDASGNYIHLLSPNKVSTSGNSAQFTFPTALLQHVTDQDTSYYYIYYGVVSQIGVSFVDEVDSNDNHSYHFEVSDCGS